MIVSDRRLGNTKGSRCDRPVSLLDIFPTLSDLCGLKTPTHLEGESLTPLLRDPTMQTGRAVVSTYQFNNHTVRSQYWRYIRYADGSEELYDHRVDSAERKNLASDESLSNVKERLVKFLPKRNAPQRIPPKSISPEQDSR